MQTFAEFLEGAGPNQEVTCASAGKEFSTAQGPRLDVDVPKRIDLYCRQCKGMRGFFTRTSDFEIYVGYGADKFLTYQCKDCESIFKVYALRIRALKGMQAVFRKYGENPPFGPSYNARVGELLGTDDHLYRKGLDCEAEGMGIGAFAYYRRVLESQRAALFDRVIMVAERLSASVDLVQALRKARDERQFTKAIDAIKAGPLQAIYVNGHNPLTLLYDAISDGLHGQTDQENMEIAQTIRLLLADLTARLDNLLADHKGVEDGVNRLLKAQADRKARQQTPTVAAKPE